MITHTWNGPNRPTTQCIFTHIARCGGSTIERLFLGVDYWVVNPNEKHIPAQIQKKLYYPYWNSYYKFTIVRNPFERIRSLWKYREHYGLSLNKNGEIELKEYKKLWNYPKIIEYNREVPIQIVKPEELTLSEGSLYQNFIDPDMEVFKFENFSSITTHLISKFLLNPQNLSHMQRAIAPKPPLSQKSMEIIREIHDKDFDLFGYSRDYDNS